MSKPISLAWNPIQDLPRNKPCFCDSGKKFKKCCLPNQPKLMEIELARLTLATIQEIQKK
jgi:uncharacterized protein YecA (UPF0149 family)